MSIIVAKVDNEECIFLSDTKVSIDIGDKTVTGGEKTRMPPNEGVLKIQLVTPVVCIAFAGNVEISREILHSLTIKRPISVNELLLFLKVQLELRDDNSEFIIGAIQNDNTPILFKVNLHKIQSGKSFWIGEHEAFNEFQSYFINSSSKNIVAKAKDSFRKLLDNTNIKTIGDFMISASFNKGTNSFKYDLGSESIGGFDSIVLKANEETVFSTGNAEVGTFTVNNLISNNINYPAICLYFSNANVAYLYLPISEFNPDLKPKIIFGSLTEVVEKIKFQFRIQLTGCVIKENGKIIFI